jgi:hypothetical protein
MKSAGRPARATGSALDGGADSFPSLATTKNGAAQNRIKERTIGRQELMLNLRCWVSDRNLHRFERDGDGQSRAADGRGERADDAEENAGGQSDPEDRGVQRLRRLASPPRC